MSNKLRVLEFYSGIGGWSFGLDRSGVSTSVLAAFDINTLTNEVYAANHSLAPCARSIDQLNVKTLEKHAADLWVMSPPCQPFTRNNTSFQRDMNDPRTKSFLHLLEQLRLMEHPPKFIALENVVGFESSVCCEQFLGVLAEKGYDYRQFQLNAAHFQLPNQRPRYYCTAWQADPSLDTQTVEGTKEVLLDYIPGIEKLESPQVGGYLDKNLTPQELAKLVVPMSLMTTGSAAWCFDIRDARSDTTACFTKSYSRYIKGTGSILHFTTDTPLDILTDDHLTSKKRSSEEMEGGAVEEPSSTEGWWRRYVNDDHLVPTAEGTYAYLRYFSPRELLNMFGFPSSFVFPEHVKAKKQYELIGNSVNVKVVSHLLDFLLQQR